MDAFQYNSWNTSEQIYIDMARVIRGAVFAGQGIIVKNTDDFLPLNRSQSIDFERDTLGVSTYEQILFDDDWAIGLRLHYEIPLSNEGSNDGDHMLFSMSFTYKPKTKFGHVEGKPFQIAINCLRNPLESLRSGEWYNLGDTVYLDFQYTVAGLFHKVDVPSVKLTFEADIVKPKGSAKIVFDTLGRRVVGQMVHVNYDTGIRWNYAGGPLFFN